MTVLESVPVTATHPALLAKVGGEPLTRLPHDLYIPPDALEVFLETFEGPLDLLLYLIRKNNLDICDIAIAEITRQYMSYLELMRALQLELAAEYLVMAAMLAEIKSRLLLPRPSVPEDEDDPRNELIRRLQEYQRFKQAAEQLDELPRLERDLFSVLVVPPSQGVNRPQPQVELSELLTALRGVLERAQHFSHHHIQREQLSVRERMGAILDQLDGQEFVPFLSLFTITEGRAGVVVTLLAALELLREALLELVQVEPFAPIYLRSRA